MADPPTISFEDMVGSAPPVKSQADELPSGAVTADAMFGTAPKPDGNPTWLDSLSQGAKKYWTDYVKLSNDYAAAVKGDLDADPKGLADQVVHSGKTLLDVLGAAFSPLESVARTGVIEPVQTAINKMSGLAAQHLAAPDVYNAQERRERFMAGMPVQQQYPGGVDWHVHQADVERTAQDLNQFIEIGGLTATGFIGAKPTVATRVAGEVDSARLPLRDMVRVEAGTAASALQGLKELPVESLDSFPGLKDSVERLTSSVKQLAIQDPDQLLNLADHVGKADPALSSRLKEIGAEALTLDTKAQEALGEQLAKPRVRQVGTTLEGKPILRLVPPEQGLSNSVAEGYEALKTPSTTPPEVVKSANEAYAAQLLRESGEAPAALEVEPMLKVADNASPEVKKFAEDWNQLHEQMSQRYEAAADSGRPLGAHTVLDTMLKHANVGSYASEFIWKLRQNVDNIPVSFTREIKHRLSGNVKPDVLGYYYPSIHEVDVRVIPGGQKTTHVLLHELTHAATMRWMKANPTHPLMREVDRLLAEAKQHLNKEVNGSYTPHYGLTDSTEFVAEAMTSAKFQSALARIKGPPLQESIFSRLANIIRRMLGLPPGHGTFLHQVMKTTESIMAEQAKRLPAATRDQPAAMAKSRVTQVGTDARGQPVYADANNPVVFDDHGVPVTRRTVEQAFTFVGDKLDRVPGMSVVLGKLREYYTQVIQTVNPEAFGPEAKTAAAVLAKRIAIQMQRDSFFVHQASMRRKFWNSRLADQKEFIRKFEKGEKFDDPLLERAALTYRVWNERILGQDLRNGLDYEPVDNYLYHTFKDSEGVSAFFKQRYGAAWGNPKFIGDRGFELYDQAVAAGYEPRFTNPEDIMLARQHASDVAQMRIDVLSDLEAYGLAVRAEGRKPEGFMSSEWRAPNGARYWVHDTANHVMQNAFNTTSLWTTPGIVGDLFRGAMWLKNTIVPIKLALSLFHPIHVATIDNATGMVRASKELLSGTMSPGKFVKEMLKATFYADLISAPRMGSRILRAYQGKIALTPADDEALRLMAEGGFIPEMSSQYRTGALDKFRDAVQRRSVTAAWHLPFAGIEALQYPIFRTWIPSLKIASYLKDAQTAFRTDPTLLMDPIKRQVALRRIAKSVDNRYGEMAYNTLFWNRWVKDLAVANTLSLGWQMGFIREYGGGALDLGQLATKQGGFVQKVKSGMLDRPLFVTYYTTQALAYGGLMTWALSGESPKGLMDYVYPKNGEVDSEDKPQRVTTMFYPREFAAIYKHMENEGVVAGLGHLASSKASGVIGLTADWATGVDSFGREFRDPNAPAYKKVEQTLAYTLGDLEPISIGAIKRQVTEEPVKTTVMNVAGFSPAPKYVTEAKTEGAIKRLYQKYYAPRQTPFEKAQFSDEARRLRQYWDKGDTDKFVDLLDQMQDKYELTGKELRQLERKLQGGTGNDQLLGMFSRLTWQQQKRLLDQMTEDERAVYLPKSNRQHLRYNYEPPEDQP